MSKRTTTTTKTQLTKLRHVAIWAWIVLILMGAVSTYVNVTSVPFARKPVSVAAFAPIAMIAASHLALSILSVKLEWWQKALSIIALVASVGMAGFVSYWHIVRYVTAAGESAITAHLFFLTVDAPMLLAGVVLVVVKSKQNVLTPPTTTIPVATPKKTTKRTPDPKRSEAAKRAAATVRAQKAEAASIAKAQEVFGS